MQHVRSERFAKQRERSAEIGRDIIERPSEMRRDGAVRRPANQAAVAAELHASNRRVRSACMKNLRITYRREFAPGTKRCESKSALSFTAV